MRFYNPKSPSAACSLTWEAPTSSLTPIPPSVCCPVCEALSHQRCLDRNPKQYVTPHAEHATLATSTADRAANRLVVFSAPSPASANLAAIHEADRAAAVTVRSPRLLDDRGSLFPGSHGRHRG